MIVEPIRCRIFHENQSLVDFMSKFVPRLQEGDVLVVTSKIVALAEGRVAENTRGAKTRLIRRESERMYKTPWCYLTLKDGHWCPNAGIDESNGNGKLVLWPRDSYAAASALRKTLLKKFHLRRLGILVTDSRPFPLRDGVTGVALGYAGFRGLRDYRGRSDIFGRPMKMSQTNVADALAAAAVLVMGEGKEQTPLCLIREAPVTYCSSVDRTELSIDPKEDLYGPILTSGQNTG